MNTDQLWHLCAATHSACNPGARRLPKTRAIQQLVQAGEISTEALNDALAKLCGGAVMLT